MFTSSKDRDNLNRTDKGSVYSDPTEPRLVELIQGHCVDGVALCPSSVYADMALTAGYYICQKQHPDIDVPAMDLSCFDISNPFIIREGGPFKEIEVEATRDLKLGSIQIKICSTTGSSSIEHARCMLTYGDNKQLVNRWSRQLYFLRDRIKIITSHTTTHPIDRLRGDMVYKIFSSIVKYSMDYKGIQELHMDSKNNDAVAKIRFRQTPKDCIFTKDPCWMDCMAQMAGFVLNGGVNAPTEAIYMSTGWDSLQISTSITGDKEYMLYSGRVSRTSDSHGGCNFD